MLFAILVENVCLLFDNDKSVLEYVSQSADGQDFYQKQTDDETMQFCFTKNGEECRLTFYPCVSHSSNSPLKTSVETTEFFTTVV
jgi:hypothetical protein